MKIYPLSQQIISQLEITLHKLNFFADNLGKLRLLKNTDNLVYKSPLALILAQKYNLPAPPLAFCIAENFSKNNFVCSISGESWLEFTIIPETLSNYLNEFSVREVIYPQNYQPKISLNFRQVYIFSRGCRLLCTGHFQNIITLNNLSFKVNQWQIKSPHNIDYCMIISQNSYEMNLIKKIIYTDENLFNTTNNVPYLTIVEEVRRALEEVEKHCRLQGEFAKKNPDLVIARLGLIALALRHYQNLCYQVSSQILPSEL